MSEKNKQSNLPADPEKTANPEAEAEKKHPSPAPQPGERSTKASVEPSHDKAKKPPKTSEQGTGQKSETYSNTAGAERHALSQSPAAPEKTGSAAKRGNGLPLLALIAGAVAIALAGYTYQQFRESRQAVEKTLARAQRTENNLEALNEKVADLKSTIATTTQTLDESTVKRMIAAASASAEKPVPDEAEIKRLITKELDEQEAAYRLTEKQVQAMIDETLRDYERNDGAKTAYAAQSETVSRREEAVKNALSALDAHAERLKQTLTVKAQALDSELRQTAEASDASVLTAPLTLAAIASQGGDYRSAARYLALALSAYDNDHLNQAPYLVFKTRIAKAKNTLERLAEENDRAAVLAALGTEVANWPFRAANVKNKLTSAPQHERNGLTARIEQAGRDILSKAFTVSKNDATGLFWINTNQHLQGIVRESVRLDLAYARNLAMRHDDKAIRRAATTLKKRISRYFDTQNDSVKGALEQLDRVTQVPGEAPDLAALAQAVEKALKE